MTSTLLLLCTLAAPAALISVALVARSQPGRSPHRVLMAARLALPIAVVGGLGGTLHLALLGPATSPLLGVRELGFAIRIDALSLVMMWLVIFMGGVVLRFSRNYLDGDARHGAFLGGLALTVGSVLLLVLAGNLLHLATFWALTSFALHRLLLFYPERRGAVTAARKKFIVARAGDLCLAAAALLVWRSTGTGDIVEAMAAVGSQGASLPLGIAAGLVAAAAALKSAVFPTHGWLLDVMETPTPVSALLHAGIINGGTFLVVRLADLVLLSPLALTALILVGGSTAVIASVVLTTQSSVKIALGWSSAAHMGFMLMLCGLGAFPVAILHLVAHSFYKAHAFLSSGSAVELPAMPSASRGVAPSWGRIVIGFVAAAAGVGGIGALLGVNVAEKPVTLGLALIISIALTQLWVSGLAGARSSLFVIGRTALAAAATTLAFFGLELTAAWLLSSAVPVVSLDGPVTLALLTLVIVVFAAVVTLQLRLPAFASSPTLRALRVHARNGFYANDLFDRLVGTWRAGAPELNPTPRSLR